MICLSNTCVSFSVFIYFVYEFSHVTTFKSPAEWALQVLREPSITPLVHQSEAGFALDEKEMLKFHIWPMGIIPYYIDDLSFDKVLKDTIRLYLDNVNKVTGLRFTEIPRPPEDEKDRWVLFINRKAQLRCADVSFHSFTNEGVQRVVLGYDCLAGGRIGAVVLSLVGVPPQHNAPNRHDYIEVVNDNILPDKLYLFEKLKDDDWLFYEIEYDYNSAGHYASHEYTSNGNETIIPIKNVKEYSENSGIGFTWRDLAKIRMLYNYITRHRDFSVKIPGCDKLFTLGLNFSYFHSNNIDKIQPRKKPSRYLLLPEETVHSGDENEAKREYENSFENNENNELNATNSKEVNEDNIQDLNKVAKNKNIVLLAHALSHKEKILKDTDYETGDEGKKNKFI